MPSNQIFYCGVQCVVGRLSGKEPLRQEILLGRRCRTTGEGCWSLPGGHVELQETPVETATRELQEETGLIGRDPRPGEMFFTYSTDVPYAHVPVIFDHVIGTPEVIIEECFSELMYFDLKNLPEPIFEPSRIVLETLGEEFSPQHTTSDVPSRRITIDMSFVSCESATREDNLRLTWDGHENCLTPLPQQCGKFSERTMEKISSDPDQMFGTLQDKISSMVSSGFYTTDLRGEIEVDQVSFPLPDLDGLQVVSTSFMQRVLEDAKFRETVARNCFSLRGDEGQDSASGDHGRTEGNTVPSCGSLCPERE